jgi:hypothetical protein
MGSLEWRWARIGVCPMSAKGKAGAGVIPATFQPFERLTCELIQYSGFLVEWLVPAELPLRVLSLDILLTVGDGRTGGGCRPRLNRFPAARRHLDCGRGAMCLATSVRRSPPHAR